MHSTFYCILAHTLLGSVLLTIRPQASVLSLNQLHHYCSFCTNAAPPQGLKRCTKCRKVWYCNAVCYFFMVLKISERSNVQVRVVKMLTGRCIKSNVMLCSDGR